MRLSAGLVQQFRADRITPGHVARPLAADLARLAYRVAAELPDTMETRHALGKLLEARGAILSASGWVPRRRRVAALLPEPTGPLGEPPPSCYGPCGRHLPAEALEGGLAAHPQLLAEPGVGEPVPVVQRPAGVVHRLIDPASGVTQRRQRPEVAGLGAAHHGAQEPAEEGPHLIGLAAPAPPPRRRPRAAGRAPVHDNPGCHSIAAEGRTARGWGEEL